MLKDYITNLAKLTKEWCEGISETPSDSVIQKSINLLTGLRYPESELVVSPIPVGGVSFEVKNVGIKINIYNNYDNIIIFSTETPEGEDTTIEDALSFANDKIKLYDVVVFSEKYYFSSEDERWEIDEKMYSNVSQFDIDKKMAEANLYYTKTGSYDVDEVYNKSFEIMDYEHNATSKYKLIKAVAC